jgi:hypothetical protein
MKCGFERIPKDTMITDGSRAHTNPQWNFETSFHTVEFNAHKNEAPSVKFIISETTLGSQPTSSHLLHTSFFFGVFFDGEDGGDMFLQNVG